MHFHRILLSFLVMTAMLCGCGKAYRFATEAEARADTSFIYRLPYPDGKSYFLIQGYNSHFSHRGRLGLDFKMPKGSVVAAARGGVVTDVIQDHNEGGPHRSYFRKANYINIRHSDGTFANYGHLRYKGALVQPGDTVQQGQAIARSGNTGFSAFPHLHFAVFRLTSNGRKALPTRFYTRRGIRYLKPGAWYRAIKTHPTKGMAF